MIYRAMFPSVTRLLKLTKGISRGYYSSSVRVLQHGEYNVRQIGPEHYKDVIEFRYEQLKASADPLSNTFDAFQQDFYYDCCDTNFHCLVALKNTKDYMDGIKHLNESSYLVSKQKLSWFTEERKKKLGIVDESNRKITEEMGNILGTVDLWVNQNACEVFSNTPVDSKWSTKGKKDAYVQMMVSNMVRKIGIDSELFYFAKRIASEKNMDKLFMQVEDAAGLKFAAKVGLQVIPTVPKTSKILLGKKLTQKDMHEGLDTYVEW